MVIGSDGRVMVCGNDEMSSHIVGDVNEESMNDIWHGKKMNKAREIHSRHKGTEEMEVCKACYLPRETQREKIEVKNGLLNIDNYVNREQTVGK